MTPPGTFDRVYAAIRLRLREGFYRPGERLEPSILSDELNASVTPVRDALHRLTGERLVEAPRHEGFRMPMMTETGLRHLYAWQRDLLLLAIMSRRTTAPDPAIGASTDASEWERQNALFLAIARSTGNPEHVAALEGLTQRLEPVRRLEQSLLDAMETETSDILQALLASDRKALRRSVVRHHRRRERIVAELLAMLIPM